MKKLRILFIPADANNHNFAQMLINSIRKFHTEEELPIAVVDNPNPQDKDFWYRATPVIAKQLLAEYETVIKVDADSIVTGNLSHVWEGDFDIACVNNANPREYATYPVSVWDIHPLAYLNNGFVVMKSEAFVNHWFNLCMSPHFASYQFREQDLLNIMCFYMEYKVQLLDSGDKWHGLISKGYWPQIELRGSSDQAAGSKLVLPKNEEWPVDSDKEICVIHWAGGNSPDKMKFKLRFKDGMDEAEEVKDEKYEVVKYLEGLVKP